MSNVRGWSSVLFVSLVAASSCASHVSALDAPQEHAHIDGVRERFPAFGDLLRGAARAPAIPTPDGFAIAPRDDGAKSRGAWRNAGRPLRASLGARADEPLRLRADGAPEIAVRRLGASVSAGRLDGGAVVYDEAFAGVSAVVFATDAGVEELLVANDPEAAIAYAVDVPPGFRLVSAAGGIAELRDAGGAARLRMRAGAAWDAGGQRVPVDVRVEGDRIRIALDGAAEPPVAIDPEWLAGGQPTVPRVYHTSTLLSNGRVLIAGGDEFGTAELFDPRTGTLTATDSLSRSRYGATATLLRDGTVLVFGGNFDLSNKFEFPAYPFDPESPEIYDPGRGEFTILPSTGAMPQGQSGHTATLLQGGQVLIAGGGGNGVTMVVPWTAVYEPLTRTFEPSSEMVEARAGHAAVALPGGRVLVVGGFSASGFGKGLGPGITSAEVFDPMTRTFTTTGPMAFARAQVAAALLPSGKVLVVGGEPAAMPALPAEVYDPKAGTFTPAGTPQYAHRAATATLLPSGCVLIAGSAELQSGLNPRGTPTGAEAHAEIFDPETNTFLPAPPMAVARGDHRATLLPAARVLVTGGLGVSATSLASAEVYDPAERRLDAPSLIQPRSNHTATALASGEVLLAGGDAPFDDSMIVAASADRYDPSSGLVMTTNPMVFARASHAAVRLPSGKVLVAGGRDQAAVTATAELFDPVSRVFAPTGSMKSPRHGFTATLLPSGKVLVTGGLLDSMQTTPLQTAEIYDPATGLFSATGSMAFARSGHTAVLLPSGKVFVAGGADAPLGTAHPEIYDPAMETFTTLAAIEVRGRGATATSLTTGDVVFAGGVSAGNPSADIFDVETGTFGPAAELVEKRYLHAAARLSGDEVLLAGGSESPLTAERVDATIGVSAPTSKPMHVSRTGHTATPLAGIGKVLIAGGTPSAGVGLEIYDRSTDSFETAKSGTFRREGTLTLLPSGKVLVAGGVDDSGSVLSGLETYDPKTSTFEPAGSLAVPRFHHTATLLASGKVLIAGGEGKFPSPTTATAEIFDPKTGTSTPAAGSMTTKRTEHTATLLPSGKVLIAGGRDAAFAAFLLESAEVFDPAKGTFTPTHMEMSVPRAGHGAGLLPSGKVLIAAGTSGDSPANTAEIYDPVTDTFTSQPALSIPGLTFSTVLGSGDVLFVGDTAAFRYIAATSAFEVVDNAPKQPVAAVPLATGDALVCGRFTCAVFVAPTGMFGPPIGESLGLDGAGGPLASGEALIAWGTPGLPIRFTNLPGGVVRPILSSAPPKLPAGTAVTVEGQRFTRLSARGSAASAPAADTAPLAFFMPAAGGGPLFGVVTDWTDNRLTWRVPSTVHAGPGWLHIVVDGVPSVGFHVELTAATIGAPCSFDGECGSGFCTEGVCCDRRCDDACHSCLADEQSGGGKDGTCSPIPAGISDPKGLCPKASAGTCGNTGLCDDKGRCAVEADGTMCGTAGGRCSGGTCTLLVQCQSNLDCIPQFVCGADRRCQPIIAPPAEEESSCATRPRGGPSPAPWGAAGILVIAALLRRIATKARTRTS